MKPKRDYEICRIPMPPILGRQIKGDTIIAIVDVKDIVPQNTPDFDGDTLSLAMWALTTGAMQLYLNNGYIITVSKDGRVLSNKEVGDIKTNE